MDRAPAALFGLPAPGPGWVSRGWGPVPPILLPLHGRAPEHALVGACPLLLHLDQRALPSFGVHADLQVQSSLLEDADAVADSVVAAVLRCAHARPRVMAEIRQLIVRMATENRDWGYTRIRGALSNLGHDVSRGAIATVLREHGLEPAPERTKRTTWREFLAAHWDVMAAADFFTVEVWLPRGLTRFTVLVLIELATRRVEIAGITADPDGPWVTQLARNATDAEDGFLRGRRFLIHDRDPLFTDAVRDTLAAAGVPPVRLPARSPNLNAFAERFVRTSKESCVERFVLIGERSLRRAVFEFVAHYHHERNHQGLDNQLILPPATPGRPHGPIRCRHRLGGMLKCYYRPAPDQQPMRPRRHRCS